MATTTSVPTPENKTEDVYYDVYTWLGEIRKRGGIPITGIFRTAQILNRYFKPAYLWDGEDLTKKFGEVEIATLSKYLGQKVLCFKPHEMLGKVRGWISLGVEQTPPTLPKFIHFRIAILHDCMAFSSVFGSLSRSRFMAGITQNNFLGYVSETAKAEYLRNVEEYRLEVHKGQVLFPFPQCHHLSSLPELEPSLSVRSLSVHSLFTYKNPNRLIETVKHQGLGRVHTHVGQNHLPIKEMHQLRLRFKAAGVQWREKCDDLSLVKYYRNTAVFMCLSRREGFSLPAMEAILQGARFVILSAIPAHLEVYGGLSVNFVSPELGDFLPKELRAITPTDRDRLFTTRTPSKMVEALLQLLQ